MFLYDCFVMKFITFCRCIALGFLLGCASGPLDKKAEIQIFRFPKTPVIGTTLDGKPVSLGGFSGLSFEGQDSSSGEWKFITHTDRGPNPDPVTLPDNTKVRPFSLPK